MTTLHPYPPFVPAGATSLLIGSVPPQRFCLDENGGRDQSKWAADDVDFFYGRRDNAFWDLMSNALAFSWNRTAVETLPAYLKERLIEHGIGITDIYKKVVRSKDNSALDADIDEGKA